MEGGEVDEGVGGQEEVGDDGRDGVQTGCGRGRREGVSGDVRKLFFVCIYF